MPMNKHNAFLLLLLSLILMPSASANNKDFDTEKMLSDLQQQLRLSKEKYEQMKPELEQTLEQKSRELKSTINEQVEEGFVELESMSKKLDAASAEARSHLEKALNSEQAQELKTFLASIDEDAIREAREKLLTKLTNQLELTAEQLEKLKPILRDYMVQASELLKQISKDSSDAFKEYSKKYEMLAKDAEASMKGILDSEQMAKLKQQIEDVRQKVNEKVFAASK